MIYVLRHGESLANVDLSVLSKSINSEIPLTEKGKTQAEEAAVLLHKEVPKNISIYTSPYLRCVQTAVILAKKLGYQDIIQRNILLSEINSGDQEGCNTEEFENRPLEKFFYSKNETQYKPQRGESFLDLHVRAGLFVMQQELKNSDNVSIIVSHASVCLMLHYFLTSTVPNDSVKMKAVDYWPNALVRKYSNTSRTFYQYAGMLQKDKRDVLI